MSRIATMLLAASLTTVPVSAGAALAEAAAPTTVAEASAPTTVAAPAEAPVTLSGSRASMLRQNRIAKEEAYSFLRTSKQVRRYVEEGYLVPLEGGEDYRVIAGHPFARPVVRAFVERLSARYRAACGEQLVVTSLTRPSTRQPGNASALSVHPAGMAVDLRVSGEAACRDWLSDELLELEAMGLLDATRERRPPHYHVAVFPTEFGEYDANLAALEAEAERRAREAALRESEVALALLQLSPDVAVVKPAAVLHVIAAVVALLFLPISV